MRLLKQVYAIGTFVLLAILVILPVFNVDAGENENFSITVETDKEAYEIGETVDYLIKVKGYTLPHAVEKINGRTIEKSPVFCYQPKEKKLQMPALSDTTNRAFSYLISIPSPHLQSMGTDPRKLLSLPHSHVPKILPNLAQDLSVYKKYKSCGPHRNQ